MLKKILWKVGVYSYLSECLIGDGRDSAKRVVSETIPFKFSLLKLKIQILSIRATAWAEIPSSRPVKPSFSVVVAVIET